MKKILILTLVVLYTGNSIFAQKVKTVLGDIDNSLKTCLLVLKDGRSVFRNYDFKNKYHITNYLISIYNENLNMIVEKKLEFKSKDFTEENHKKYDITINTVFEINGKIVLFVDLLKKGQQDQTLLYRIIMNSTTAEIENEELLFTINRVYSSFLSAYGTDNPEYIVAKDENSDYYAVIKYAYQKRDDVAKNYEVKHYSPDHKEISSASFDYVDNTYEYTRPLFVTVFSDKYVMIANFAFNSEKKKDKDTKVVFSKLEKGKKTFIHKELNYSENYSTDRMFMVKNNKLNMLQSLIFVQHRNFKNEITSYSLAIQGINPDNMELYKPFSAPVQMLNTFCEKRCDDKNAFEKPIYLDFGINSKGNNVLCFKEPDGMGTHRLIGFSEFNNDGKEISAWAFSTSDDKCIPIYTAKGNYALVGEVEENMNKPINEKSKMPNLNKPIRDNLVLVSFGENGEINKEYVFGQPEKKKNVDFQLFRYYYDDVLKTIVSHVVTGNDYKHTKLGMVKIF